MQMVTYETLFQFGMFIVAIVALVMDTAKKK